MILSYIPSRLLTGCLWLLTMGVSMGQSTNLSSIPTPLPDVGHSILRMLSALALVLALFFAGIWLARNWQRLMVMQKGRTPKLNIIEVRPIGNRQILYVIGYEQQRMLISSSPAGTSLLSHLPSAEPSESSAPPAPSFVQALQQMMSKK